MKVSPSINDKSAADIIFPLHVAFLSWWGMNICEKFSGCRDENANINYHLMLYIEYMVALLWHIFYLVYLKCCLLVNMYRFESQLFNAILLCFATCKYVPHVPLRWKQCIKKFSLEFTGAANVLHDGTTITITYHDISNHSF